MEKAEKKRPVRKSIAKPSSSKGLKEEIFSSAIKSPFLKNLQPMLATLIKEPFDSNDWIAETKWDGYRAIGEINNKTAKLYSRKGNYYREFKEITNALEQLDFDAVVDGELIVSNKEGLHDFHFIRSYSKNKARLHVTYKIFDLLYYEGYDLRNIPLIKRKQLLEMILPSVPHLEYSGHVTGKGIKLFELAQEARFEGIVLKKSDSIYESGERGKNWLKVKVENIADAVVIGFTIPNKTRLFGSLLLGIFEGKELKYYGHAINVPEIDKDRIYSIIKKYETDRQPIKEVPSEVLSRGVHWMKPELVCEVQYNQIMGSGKLRHASYRRLRDDINAEDIQRESL